MTRASHSSYWSFSGGWRASINRKLEGMNFSIRRRAELLLVSASKWPWNERIWSLVHSLGKVAKASGEKPMRQ